MMQENKENDEIIVKNQDGEIVSLSNTGWFEYLTIENARIVGTPIYGVIDLTGNKTEIL